MRYLIDGYNLLFAIGWLLRQDQPQRRRWARQRLLTELVAWHGDDAGQVTVVFDAGDGFRGAAAEETVHGVRVLYALRQQADDLIEELIRKDPDPRHLTVVSNDHRLQQAARHRHCPVLACLDYHDQVSRP